MMLLLSVCSAGQGLIEIGIATVAASEGGAAFDPCHNFFSICCSHPAERGQQAVEEPGKVIAGGKSYNCKFVGNGNLKGQRVGKSASTPCPSQMSTHRHQEVRKVL
jgi:hypothetical protein